MNWNLCQAVEDKRQKVKETTPHPFDVDLSIERLATMALNYGLLLASLILTGYLTCQARKNPRLGMFKVKSMDIFKEDKSYRELDTLSKSSVKLTEIGMNLFSDTLRENNPAYSQKNVDCSNKRGFPQQKICTVRVKDGMSLRNGLRNGIIMRNLKYAE